MTDLVVKIRTLCPGLMSLDGYRGAIRYQMQRKRHFHTSVTAAVLVYALVII
jgi:hypothetical protein